MPEVREVREVQAAQTAVPVPQTGAQVRQAGAQVPQTGAQVPQVAQPAVPVVATAATAVTAVNSNDSKSMCTASATPGSSYNCEQATLAVGTVPGRPHGGEISAAKSTMLEQHSQRLKDDAIASSGFAFSASAAPTQPTFDSGMPDAAPQGERGTIDVEKKSRPTESHRGLSARGSHKAATPSNYDQGVARPPKRTRR